MADLKKLCSRGWWPLMSLARELRVNSVEASLRTVLQFFVRFAIIRLSQCAFVCFRVLV